MTQLVTHIADDDTKKIMAHSYVKRSPAAKSKILCILEKIMEGDRFEKKSDTDALFISCPCPKCSARCTQ